MHRRSPPSIAHFERPLLGFFLRATGRPELAADLTAETFACALESLRQIRPRSRPGRQIGCSAIARNVLGSSYRSSRVEAGARRRLGLPRLVIDDHAGRHHRAPTAGHEHATLALAGLPEHQRQAIQAHVLQERDYADIAGELHCSEAVVRQRVSRGLRTLRARLAR